MKAVSSDLPEGEGWAYEIKWDGMRIVAYINHDDEPLRLETTRQLDATDRFPELAGLADILAPHRVILDGEVVAFEGGRPRFDRLQRRMHVTVPAEAVRRAAEDPITYVVFDLLHLDGHDVTPLPYHQRRKLLRDLLEDGPAWQVPDHYVSDGSLLFEAVRQQGLEGLIAKRIDSRYLPGKRSPIWRKVKVRNRQEVVIGGWQPGTGNRAGTFGSLLVGYYDDGGDLHYAGAVGTGFNDHELQNLTASLKAREVAVPPFEPAPPIAVRRTARWVRPELVCEVTFGSWTEEDILRHASYVGLRADKEPTEVVREPAVNPGPT